MNGVKVHPPLYTKVMGRPKKNRRKTPQEKEKKKGTKILTRSGMTMHCSICGNPNHNKKGHNLWVSQQCNLPITENEEYDDPTILQV
jgi:hypothetical protein